MGKTGPTGAPPGLARPRFQIKGTVWLPPDRPSNTTLADFKRSFELVHKSTSKPLIWLTFGGVAIRHLSGYKPGL
jgi:hypothetical protein